MKHTKDAKPGSDMPSDPSKVTDAEWRERLTAEQYYVTRQKGTERAFTGKYDKHFEPGTYTCICCGETLFVSAAKYNSGCGWPAFHTPADAERITETEDRSHGMIRTEVTCTRCGAYLGHLFDDGPAPTGVRYCINSASLDFRPQKGESNDAPDEK